MHRFVSIYGGLWTTLLLAAPVAVSIDLLRLSTAGGLRRNSRVAILGFLVTLLLLFSLASTVLSPFAILALPAPVIFAAAIVRPSVLVRKELRIYLVCCMAAGELLWIWGSYVLLVAARS